LKHLNGRSLSGPHSKVQVSSFPGCTTSDMADHTRPLVRRRPDSIIIHVGTNSLRSATSSRECADEIVDLARLVEQEDITVAGIPNLRVWTRVRVRARVRVRVRVKNRGLFHAMVITIG